MVTLASPIISVSVDAELGPADETHDIKVDYSAVGDGVTNDATAFTTFQTAQTDSPGVTRLDIPAGTYVVTGGFSGFFMSGIPDLQIVGPATFANNINMGARASLRNSPLYSVRLDAVSAGALSVTVKDVDPARRGDGSTGDPNRTLSELMALFNVGDKVLISAYDTQGFGYPPNPGVFEYREITDITSNTITFDVALDYSYPDDLPHYTNGSGNVGGVWTGLEIDQGGPATLYALNQVWGTRVKVKDITINMSGEQFVAFGGRMIVLDNVTATGTQVWPGSAKNIIMRNCTIPSVEVDKLGERLDCYNVNSGQLIIQSANPNDMMWTRGTVGNGSAALNGSPRRATFKNVRFNGSIGPGATAYGITESLRLENCADLANNWTTNYRTYLFSSNSAVLSGNTITGDGTFGREWAFPGAKCWLGISSTKWTAHVEVTDFYRSGSNNVVVLDVTPPTYSEGSYDRIVVHPCPDFTAINCTGGVFMEQYTNAPNNTPINSYMRYWMGSDGLVKGGGFSPIGRVVSYTVNVTKPYTGAQSSLALNTAQFGVTGLNLATGVAADPRFNPRVNLKIAGERVFTPSGTTGAQTGDGSYSNDMWLWGSSVPMLNTSAAGNAVLINGEDPSVWPEFVAELIVDPFYQP